MYHLETQETPACNELKNRITYDIIAHVIEDEGTTYGREKL
jgi:hypothetical protein